MVVTYDMSWYMIWYDNAYDILIMHTCTFILIKYDAADTQVWMMLVIDVIVNIADLWIGIFQSKQFY